MQFFCQEFGQSEVQHFIRDGSDHAPLHDVCRSLQISMVKPFRFLNFCTDHQTYRKVVENVWELKIDESPFYSFNEKLKMAINGDFFQQLATLEDVVRMEKVQLEVKPSDENREELRKVEEDLQNFQKIEEDY